MREVNRVLFMGSKKLGLKTLQKMYQLETHSLIGAITIDDSDDSRTQYPEFKNFSEETGIPLFTAKNRKHAEMLVRDLGPELCFVVGWYWLIADSTLREVPNGFIGIHNSLLPKFRGGSPLNWSIITGEQVVGISVFSFSSGMDDGPIWAQGMISVEENDYISTVLEKLENKAIEVLENKYIPILRGTISPVNQDEALATYCAQRFPHDGNIDWRKPAREIYNLIRAQSDPYPGAFTFSQGEEMKIWRAKLFSKPYFGSPGQVARITEDAVYIICGDNQAVMLEQVEVNGVKGKASKFIKSFKIVLSNDSNKNSISEYKVKNFTT